MAFISLTLAAFGAFLIFLAAIAFFKAKDVFVMGHILFISNLYLVPLVLLGFEIEHFSYTSLVKILVIIFLNITISALACHSILRRALLNKISPDAKLKS